MKRAKELRVPIIGICRGAQMLCALEGGHLIQHVNNHGGNHSVNLASGGKMMVNSLHHQMMVPRGRFILEATAEQRSDVYYDMDGDKEVVHHTIDYEPEFIYYPDVKGFAIQWHPEMMAAGGEANRYIKAYVEDVCSK